MATILDLQAMEARLEIMRGGSSMSCSGCGSDSELNGDQCEVE